MNKQPPSWRRFFVYGVLIGTAAAFLVGGYLFLNQIFKDREKAMGFVPPRTASILNQTRPLSQTQSKTYTAEEIEKARREGKPLPGMTPPYSPPGPNPNDDATQRSLRTLEEINRINQMNQRLIEQNQRLQNQR